VSDGRRKKEKRAGKMKNINGKRGFDLISFLFGTALYM
jgi:hypothetical protein